MTATEVAERGHHSRPGPAARPRPLARTLRPGPARVCGVLGLGAALLLGFAGYLFGLSGLSESRFQRTSYKSFIRALGQAVAPVGPVAAGTPVAVLQIPALHISHLVVVEGTGARELTRGPGHRRDTPLPGQAGVSVLYGRRALFGAPLAHLMRLEHGDRITVTTGQGVATYVVSSFGDGAHAAPANAVNRLVLTTADSAWRPNSTRTVSADLASPPQPDAGGRPAIAASERAMAGDVDASMIALLLWAQVLALLAVVATMAARFWSPGPAYLCLAPAVLAVVWNVYENAATLLPNVY